MNQQPSDRISIPDFVAEFLAQEEHFSREAELQEWLQQDPHNRKILDEYTDLWLGSIKARNRNDYDEKPAWNRLSRLIRERGQETENRSVFSVLPVLKGIAAAAVTTLLLGITGYFSWHAYSVRQHPLTYSEYSVPYGSKSRMTLPDGSVAWLNAGSRMVISSYYGIQNRDITLEGEAHFTVVRGNKPFTVRTLGLAIEAVGTIFNVKAYPEEKTVETTVEKGAVIISDPLSETPAGINTIVRSNQRAIYRIGEENVNVIKHVQKRSYLPDGPSGTGSKANSIPGEITVTKISAPEIYTSWKDEKWIIEREELQSLAIKLERRYNVKILFGDEKLKKYVFSGVLKDETLEQVLEYIKLTAPIGYRVEHDQVTFFELHALKSQLH
jgi:transmembrane sensor